jgi:hypothetical protein
VSDRAGDGPTSRSTATPPVRRGRRQLAPHGHRASAIRQSCDRRERHDLHGDAALGGGVAAGRIRRPSHADTTLLQAGGRTYLTGLLVRISHTGSRVRPLTSQTLGSDKPRLLQS